MWQTHQMSCKIKSTFSSWQILWRQETYILLGNLVYFYLSTSKKKNTSPQRYGGTAHTTGELWCMDDLGWYDAGDLRRAGKQRGELSCMWESSWMESSAWSSAWGRWWASWELLGQVYRPDRHDNIVVVVC